MHPPSCARFRSLVRLTLLLAIGAASIVEAAALPAQAAASSAEDSRGSVYFERRSTELSRESLATIAENAARLKSNPGVSVMLVGYTDEVGSTSYGVALAQRRASAVADALVALGVDPRQIRSTASAQEAGDASCAAPDCATRYRRVEFKYPPPATADLSWPSAHRASR